MRILSLYYTDKPGGFCKRLYRLLNALAAREHEVHYLSLDPPPPALAAAVHWHRIPFPLAARQGFVFWSLLSCCLPFIALVFLLRIRPDRSVFFNPYYAALCGVPARLLKVPVVLFVRARLAEPREGFIRYGLEQLGLTAAHKIVCQTNAAAREFGRRGYTAFVLPNDIPCFPDDTQSALQMPPLIAVTSGVFVTGKNLSLLIEVFTALEARHGSGAFRLLVAGQGASLPLIKAQVAERKLRSVEFLGWVDDMRSLLRRSHVLLHPSISEGMPNSVLEALGLGMPVFGARTPELKEVLGDESLLFDPSDPSELSEKLEILSQADQMLENCRILCRARAKRIHVRLGRRRRQARYGRKLTIKIAQIIIIP